MFIIFTMLLYFYLRSCTLLCWCSSTGVRVHHYAGVVPPVFVYITMILYFQRCSCTLLCCCLFADAVLKMYVELGLKDISDTVIRDSFAQVH